MNLFSTKLAYAAPSENLDGFLANVNEEIINPLILFLFALALAFFLYGLFEFIANASNDEKRSVGKIHMFWGIIGLTIMIGVWFILGLMLNTLGLEDEIDPEQGKVKLDDYTPPKPNNLGNP